ncbi:MAG: pyridoxal-phosphate dependent enzyme [Saprospiraceae bacterium]
MINPFLPVPIEICNFNFGCQSYVLRDDLSHSEISGNKYRKLKYVMSSIMKSGAKGIITFGGPFSNHIYSTAAYANLLGLESIGIIRGEDDKDNPTLKFARSRNMRLYFVSRSAYRLKQESSEIKALLLSNPDHEIVDEGGEHPLAFVGLKEIVDEIEDQKMIPDYIAISAGTGTTAAGILRAVCDKRWKTKIIVISPMKNKVLMDKIISISDRKFHSDQLVFIDEFAGNGYAKVSEELIRFMYTFYEVTRIKLDQIYTAKLVHGLYQLSLRNFFKPNDTLLWIHTGGLQGIEGYNYMMHKLGKGSAIKY